MLSTTLIAHGNTDSTQNSEEYYEASIKTSSLGGYEFTVKAFERPSYEVLPIIGSEYFTTSEEKYKTDVANTKPSATYESKSVSKVDIVFALGDTKQSEKLQSQIPVFTNSLKSAGNYIDASVEQVKTSTIDMAAFGAREIFNTWLKLPLNNSDGGSNLSTRKNPWQLNEAKGAIYTYKAKTIGRCLTAVLDPKGFDTTDFTMSYTAYGDGECLEANGNLARNAAGQVVNTPEGPRYWGGHSYGSWFRIQELPNGTYSAYIFVAKGNGWRRDSLGTWDGITCTLAKVTNVDKNMINKNYSGYHFYPMCGGSDPKYAGQYEVDVPLYDWWGGSGFPKSMPVGGTYSARESQLTVLSNKTYEGFPESFNFEIKCTANNIRVTHDGKEIMNVNDNTNPLLNGSYGVWSGSSPDVYFTDFKITKGEKKSLGDALSNVQWRDGSAHIVIHAAETVPDDMKDEKSAEYAYTLEKLLNTNAYIINLGTNENKAALESIGSKLVTPSGEKKDVYYDSYSPNIVKAMEKSEDWIIDLLASMSKPVSWTIVNEKVLWVTYYNDNERDLPLNYGANADDKSLSDSWGIGITNYYREDPLFAEKWRYKHQPTFFDNSNITESYNDIWLDKPVELFENPGKFRVNYKRLDNPFYIDSSIGNVFNSYRQWSTDYDNKRGDN